MHVENLLGSGSKVKILRTLTEVNAGFTLGELEKETGLSRGIVHKEIRRFVKKGIIIEIGSKGKLKMYRINVNHPYYTLIADLFAREKSSYRRNVVILAVWNVLESLVSAITDKNSNVFLIRLFGSHARGTAAITSDIDLLIVLHEKNPEQETAILEICEKYGKKLGIRINPVFMKSKNYSEEFNRKTTFMEEVKRGFIDI